MSLTHFSTLWNPPFFDGIGAWCANPFPRTLVKGLAGSADALLIADLFRSSQRPVVVFVENNKMAESLCDECRTFLGEGAVDLLPSRDAVPYNMKSPFGPTVEARFRVLGRLLDGSKSVVIAPHTALLQKLESPKRLFNHIVRLHVNDEVPQDTLATWLTEIGFRRENQASDIGTFAIRGGIIDIYPFLSDNPLRVEYWGDTIDSIREFDVFTQKSQAGRQSAEIVPMREFCLSPDDVDYALEKMRTEVKDRGGNPLDIQRFEHQWKTLSDFEGIEWFLHWFDRETVSIFDYLHEQTVVVWDDLIPPARRLDEAVQNYERHLARVPELVAPFVSRPDELLHHEETIGKRLEAYDTFFCDTVEAPSDSRELRLDIVEQPSLPRELDPLGGALRGYNEEGLRCVLLSPNPGHAERLQELIGEACPFAEIALGFLRRGFISREKGLLLFSENQIMGRHERGFRVKKRKGGMPISGHDALSPGDFVVHEEHGIGRFVGIERVLAGEVHTDCMVLLFAGNARVSVPIDDFHKVQKYIGKESIAPALSTIGTGQWERLKKRTRESLKEMAKELIELYAKRQFNEGIAFTPDTLWQKEFEDAFVFDETPDQLRAIKETKKDMEAAKPMDRLVCGDVGFGKTEVAMRAAFKAVMSGYQVALLAPTTILASQHFATFSERMAAFPVRLASLSRFRSVKEQKEAAAKAAAGEVDIVIGTHRLLSADVSFKNLGLLIIDEEQRFGVRHKERLKQFRHTIDVLSLTATPIPRTLHLSLIGARDLSSIATPPRNRLPVETKVAEYHDDLIKGAIENELDRGGQVYVVNNRIKTLDAMRDRIEALVPRARVISAHGQMHERELERIMEEFVAGRHDVLLSTVIIENGLDIPNVNTIVVNRADTMGLSQLYQLRGRVGRSSEQAYAYLLTPPFGEVQQESLIRLRALEQFTELGSGFQIAMRDLEIRGAGNILGTSQHGFIAAVGFELYCRLLQEAVDELKGNAPPAESAPEVKIDIPLEAYLPTEYIADGATRIELYQELSAVTDSDALVEVERSMLDRFGPLPPPVGALLLLMRIRFAAQKHRIGRVGIGVKGELSCAFEGDAESLRRNMMAFMEFCPPDSTVVNDPPRVIVRCALSASGKLERALEALALLQRLHQ